MRRTWGGRIKFILLRFAFIFSWLLLVGGIFGIRNIIISPAIASLLDNQRIVIWLQPVYWLCILVSAATLVFHYKKHPVRFTPGVRPFEIIVWIILAAPFFYFALTRRLVLDFWLDEMISIVRHIQPSIRSALTWYPVPNNHVFTNFLGGLFIQLIGAQEMRTILSQPVTLRLLYFLPSIATVILLPYTAHRFVGKWAGWISVILLGTTIPFLNFTSQVRGYSFTMFFACLLLLFLLDYRQTHNRKYALRTILLACFLFYTIASNLYYLLALIGFYLLAGEVYRPRTWKNENRKLYSLGTNRFVIINPEMTIAVMLTAGILLALILYIPIFESVFGNRYVESFGLFRGTVFFDAFPRSMSYFFSNRDWLFLIGWLGCAGAGWTAWKKNDPQRRFILVLLTSASFLPYLISYIRGDAPFERTFLVTLPAFILLASVGLNRIIEYAEERVGVRRWVPFTLVGIIGAVAYVTFVTTYLGIETEIFENLKNENIKQVEVYDSTLWASHFLDHYMVLPVIQPAVELSGDLPILIDGSNTRFAFVIHEYLRAFGITPLEFVHPGEIDGEEAYVILSYPERSMQGLLEVYPEMTCTLISRELSIYRSYRCRFSDPS